jgi:Carboxypeptidase regulatory-like domain/TonB dependent receptor-like, beta-barrel
MTNRFRLLAFCFAIRSVCLALVLLSSILSFAQTESATMSGTVMDRSGAVVADTKIEVTNSDTNVRTATTTNKSGIYVVTGLRPGRYRMSVSKEGFRSIVVTDITLNVQDVVSRNFNLDVGAFSESITVTADQVNINTTDASVSTVVDRQFAENLPMNGRSFQALIQLTPGVVLTTSSSFSDGQFSVNGQRPDSNYWMIDGVSANIGVGFTAASDTLAGSLGGFSAQGGTNSLVSVDAMQEFRIQTSTFAPEFGRTPGGQISIVTRSGTNQFHGSAFDYLRNDVLDATDWFRGYTNSPPLPKPEERQNDFGGTFSGPILKNRTFFFFSYEGLRLRLPQTFLSTVPDASFTPSTTNSRQNAIPAMQPYLNAFPLPNPNSPEIYAPCDPTTDPNCPSSGLEATGSAAFNASYSNRSTLNATSLRVDHRLTDKLTLFGRYDYAPSELVQRPGSFIGYALSVVSLERIPTQTATVGATWAAYPRLTNDLRANYSRVDSKQANGLDNFGGATPISSSVAGLPSPYTAQNSAVTLFVDNLNGAVLSIGNGIDVQSQRQFNLVDSVSLQVGSHALKIGTDYRRLMPISAATAYRQEADFATVTDMESGSSGFAAVSASSHVPLVLQNLGLFAQDTWRIHPRLTLTYGLRWDVDFTPRTSNGPSLPTVVNFNDLPNLALAPPGTRVFSTQFGNIAPRIGADYQLLQKTGWESVLRGGWGLFYDLATTQLQVVGAYYPFGSISFVSGPFPLNPSCAPGPACLNSAVPAPITASNPTIFALDPHLKSPYTQEWNLAFEQSLGPAQSFSATYLGATGRRLLMAEAFVPANANIPAAIFVGNYGTSDYNSVQLQFRRSLAQGLQVLASYSWAHSIDTGSTGAGGLSGSDLFSRQLGANDNRGPSDFDIRNSASIALTYEVPSAKTNRFVRAISRGWSTQNIVQVRSAPPVDVNYPYTYHFGPAEVEIRPDVVPGQPLYVYGQQCISALFKPCPGGKGFNPAAFVSPPIDPTSGQPTRQGDFGRNGLRGFGAWQWDFATHRDFPLGEHVKLQFRAELFNVLNHPNFAPPLGGLAPTFVPPLFGLASQTLAQGLGSFNSGPGAFSPLYQFGGPRSGEFALKLIF